jgi:iron complex outermembrane recepter protein
MTRSRKRKLARGRVKWAGWAGMPLASTLMAVGVHAADADTNGEGQLAEITVTAQKRSEDLQKVPISLTVLGQEQLESHQVKSFDDYVKFLPSVSYQSAGPGQAQLYFRGVSSGSDGLHAGSSPPTGVYLDELPVTTIGNSLDVHMYDIQRVEALAGPQGTLYGASSLSGTLRVITNKPDPTAFSAGYDLKADKFGHGNGGGTVEGFVNIPLTDFMAIRLVGYYDYEGGYINNVPTSVTYQRFAPLGDPVPNNAALPASCTPFTSPAPGNGAPVAGTVCPTTVTNDGVARRRFNDVGSGGGRAALKIDLNENWSITPTVVAQTQKAVGDFTVNPQVGNLSVNDFITPFNNDQWVQSALTVQGKISNWELLYTGGWFQRKVDNLVDYSGYTADYDAQALYYGANLGDRAFNNAGQLLDPNQFVLNRDRYTKQSHEFRLNSPADFFIRGTAGLFYQRQTDDIRAAFDLPGLNEGFPAGSFAVQSVDGQPGTVYLSQQDRTDRDYAVFADGTIDLIPNHLHLSAGIREFWVENTLYGFFGFQSYEFNTEKGCLDSGGVPPVLPVTGNRPCVDVNAKVVENGETHRVNLSYDIDADHMVYATYSTGFRPGGVNRLTTAPAYRSDRLTNLELGWKTAWFDHHVRANGAVFYERWSDVQTATTGAFGITSIENAGNARIYGVEGDVEWALFDHLVLSASGTFLNAEFTTNFCGTNPDGSLIPSCDPADAATPKGARLPVTPHFKGNMTARYSFEFKDFNNFVQGSIIDQSATVATALVSQNANFGAIGGFNTADFSAGTGMHNWKLEAYIENAFDRRGELTRFAECFAANCQIAYHAFPIKPMNFGVRFGQKF